MLVTVMNPGPIRRLSPALLEELDRAFATISTTFIKEHTEQGSHTGAFSIPVSVQTQLDALSAAIAAVSETPWTTISKSVDENRSNDGGSGAGTVVADGELKFSMAASTTYAVRATIFFELDEVSTGNTLKHRFTGPAGSTRIQGEVRTAATAYAARVLDAYDAANQDGAAYTSAATNCRGVLYLELLVQNGSTSGDFSFSWVSGKATAASASVLKGSFLEYIQQ